MNAFSCILSEHAIPRLQAVELKVLQLNLTRTCNLSCRHCHLDCSPERTEAMTPAVMSRVVELVRTADLELVDITGGAPELHPDFRRFICALAGGGARLQVRSNLAVLTQAELAGTDVFLAEHRVGIVASLPCYLPENVDRQRGTGTYDRSIGVIKRLNRHGYGRRPELPLTLVFNPGGPALPPEQDRLEEAYRRELKERHGIVFTRLVAMANMPIGRFGADLDRDGRLEDYRRLLAEAFNPGTVVGLMCRHQVSIDWDGRVFDCDFNLALDLPANPPANIFTADPAELARRRIRCGEHCFGCTAGAGSSCGGALTG